MKILIIAEAPSQRTDGGLPLSGDSGRALAKLAEIENLDDCFDVENLIDFWPGPSPSGRGSAFPMSEARRRVRDPLFIEKINRYDRVVVLGRRVWRALGLPNDFDWLAWALPTKGPFAGVDFTLFPHPSRVNRFWNEPANVGRASRALRDLVSDAPSDPGDPEPNWRDVTLRSHESSAR